MGRGILELAAGWRRVESVALAGLVSALVVMVWAPAASAAPANDDFAAAQDLGSALPVAVHGSNVGATSEVGEPRISGAAGESIWFKWQAVETGPVTVGTCGSERPTVIGVYKGNSIGALTEIPSGEGSQGIQPFCDGTKVIFDAVAGSVYAISVDGTTWANPPSAGAISLSLERSAAPANDSFSQAQPLPLEGTSFPGDNRGATREAGEPLHRGDPGGASVWYRVMANHTGGILISACGRKFEPDVAVYTGSTVSSLNAVALNFPSKSCEYSFNAVAGASYFVAVDGKPGSEQGSVAMGEFSIGAANVPRNDDFANAFDIPANLGTGLFTNFLSNVGATKEPGEPNHAGNPGGASVWFKLTAPVAGSARLGVCNNDFHALIGVYTGSSVSSLQPVASQDLGTPGGCNPYAPGVLAFNIDAGTTYRIAVDGSAGAVGTFTMMSDIRTDRLPESGPAPTATIRKRPQTRISKRRMRLSRGRAVFILRSDQPESTFKCKLDRKPVHACASRVIYKHLRPGRYVFRAFAVDSAGADRTPVVVRFRVPK